MKRIADTRVPMRGQWRSGRPMKEWKAKQSHRRGITAALWADYPTNKYWLRVCQERDTWATNCATARQDPTFLVTASIGWAPDWRSQSQYTAPGANRARPGLAPMPVLSYNPWDQSSLADPWYILNWLSTRATWLTQRPNHYEYIGGQSMFSGVNLPIGPSAGTINYGLFVGLGGQCCWGKATNTCVHTPMTTTTCNDTSLTHECTPYDGVGQRWHSTSMDMPCPDDDDTSDHHHSHWSR